MGSARDASGTTPRRLRAHVPTPKAVSETAESPGVRKPTRSRPPAAPGRGPGAPGRCHTVSGGQPAGRACSSRIWVASTATWVRLVIPSLVSTWDT
jgi:hypothetical protein